ncbi:hypothetical protein [Variovorax boronicumulans]|uniref:hypothetical protein n=1 Tax=Variovorax boronicumulans TaxID=436515 RepID=UPI00339B57CF
MMPTLPPFILDAIAQPVGCVQDHAAWVARLRDALSGDLGMAFLLDDDTNYNPAHSLACKLSGRDEGLKKRFEFDLRFYISSKAPLFAVYCFDRKWAMVDRGEVNHPIDPARLPEAAKSLIDKARAMFAAQGLQEVAHAYFFLPAPGCATQLDGLPATVFESLFAEIV